MLKIKNIILVHFRAKITLKHYFFYTPKQSLTVLLLSDCQKNKAKESLSYKWAVRVQN